MTSTLHAADDGDETCPDCGEPASLTVALGPGTAYVVPCGCPVAPPD